MAIERLAAALLLALVALLAARDIDTPDIGFHLRAGEYVLDGNGWLRKDPFSFTMKDHEYLATSWAYEVLLALLERLGGPAALVLLHAAFAVATFAILWRMTSIVEQRSAFALPLLLLGVLASEMRFSARPELLSYLLLACLSYVLHTHAEGRKAPLWLLPFLFLVWANCHSLYVLGLALLACSLAGRFLDGFALDQRLAGWSLASVAACMLNPYGLKGLLVPATLLTRFGEDSPFRQAILEYGSPLDAAALDASRYFPWLPVWSFRLFAALALLGALGLLMRNKWWSALAILLFTWPATRMIKNMPILVVVGFAPTLWGLFLARLAHARWLRLASAGTVALAALVLGLRVRTDAYYGATQRWERTGLGWNTAILPVEAVDYLREAGIDGRGLNHLNVGGWLMWRGGVPVFIDGRLEVVGETFFAEHQQAFSSLENLEACVERWGIRWALLPWFFTPELLGDMSRDRRWTLVYADDVAALFVRWDHPLAQHPSATLTALLTPAPVVVEDLPGFPSAEERDTPMVRWLWGMVRTQAFPRREYMLGRFHQARGMQELAAWHYAAAIRESRGLYPDLYEWLGLALNELGRWSDARECFRVVLAERPNDRLTLARLAELEGRLQDTPESRVR